MKINLRRQGEYISPGEDFRRMFCKDTDRAVSIRQ
jgi:hypothetical protein